MHVLGKVLLGFVVVGAIAAIILTSAALDARTHWEEQVATAKAEYESIKTDLAAKETSARDAQQSLDRVKAAWGNIWMAQNSRVSNPATGAVNIGTGTQAGLGVDAASRAAKPTVHVFNVVDNENSQYLGEFQVQTAQAGSTDAVLNRPPFAGENFPSGTWRVRELIPYNHETQLSNVYTEQIKADARLQRMQFDVTRLQEQLAATQKLLQERVFQLEGDPNEGTPGFVQGIRDALTERDEHLAKLQKLRIERLLKLESLEDQLQSNRDRMELFSQQSQAAGANRPADVAARTNAAANGR